MTGDQYDESHIGPVVHGLAETMEPGVADMELLASISESMKVARAPSTVPMKPTAWSAETVGVEKRPLPAKAMKVPTSPMMRSRPAVRTEATFVPSRLESVPVAGLRAEGHIAIATLGLCFRAPVKISTGEGNELKAVESVSVSDSSVQLVANCLRWCRPFW